MSAYWEKRRETLRVAAALACLCVVYLILAMTSLHTNSVTVDEFGHLPAGLNLLNTGDYRYCELNPPLMNALSAVPMKLQGIEITLPRDFPEKYRHSFWDNGYLFMEQHRLDYHQLFVRSRYVTVLLVLLLGIVAFFWGRMLVPAHANRAGILASLIWFEPNIMAHARLVTTDAGIALFAVLSLFTLHRYTAKPTWARAIACGASLGLAQVVKFTALYLFPTHVAASLVLVWKQPELRTRRFLLQVLTIFIVCTIVVDGSYGFDGLFKSAHALAFKSTPFQAISSSPAAGLPIPFPEEFLLALDRQLADVQLDTPSFLFGKSYSGGKWYYFLALLAIKTPIPLLVLGALAGHIAIAGKGLPRLATLLLLFPAFTVVFMFSCFSSKQIGLRMILPAIALLWIWIATTLASVDWSRNARRAIGLLLAWFVFETVLVYPDYLAYFNQFAGGSGKGYRYAVDSNSDWGQDLPALGAYMKQQHIDDIQLLYFGRVDPGIYGINYQVPIGGLTPGLVGISRSLYGRGYFLYDHGRLAWAEPIDVDKLHAVFVATIGRTIDIYRIPPTGGAPL